MSWFLQKEFQRAKSKYYDSSDPSTLFSYLQKMAGAKMYLAIVIDRCVRISYFGGAGRDISYEITLRNGKVYTISRKERAAFIAQTTAKVQEYMSSHLSLLSDNEKEKYIMKVLKYGN